MTDVFTGVLAALYLYVIARLHGFLVKTSPLLHRLVLRPAMGCFYYAALFVGIVRLIYRHLVSAPGKLRGLATMPSALGAIPELRRLVSDGQRIQEESMEKGSQEMRGREDEKQAGHLMPAASLMKTCREHVVGWFGGF